MCVCVYEHVSVCVWSPPRYQHILFLFTLSFISLSFSTSVSLVSVSFVCLCDAAVLCVPVSPPPFHTCSVSLHSVTLCHLQLFYTARLYLSPSSLTLFLLFFPLPQIVILFLLFHIPLLTLFQLYLSLISSFLSPLSSPANQYLTVFSESASSSYSVFSLHKNLCDVKPAKSPVSKIFPSDRTQKHVALHL